MAKKKIKMLTSIAGPTWSAKPGDILEVAAEEAKRQVAAGQAELASQGAKVTKFHHSPELERITADQPPVEKAATRTHSEEV